MIKDFEKRFKLLIQGITSREFQTRVAKALIQKMYGRIKTGYGVNNDTLQPDQTKKEKLAPLSQSYVAQRKGTVAFFTRKDGVVVAYKPKSKPRLHSTASPGRSNLTMTGQMLEALKYEVDKGIRIFIANTGRDDSDLSNSEVAALASLKRPFLAVTDEEMKVVNRMYKDEINRLIRRLF